MDGDPGLILYAVWFRRVRRNRRALDGEHPGGQGGAGLAWCGALLLTALGAELVGARGWRQAKAMSVAHLAFTSAIDGQVLT